MVVKSDTVITQSVRRFDIMKYRMSQLFKLGKYYQGIMSKDGNRIYICFNDCKYGFLLMKEQMLKTKVGVFDDIPNYVKYYVYYNEGIKLSSVVETFKYAIPLLRDKVGKSLELLNEYLKSDPEVDIDNAIIWDGKKLVNPHIKNMDRYYDSHEIMYKDFI